MTSASLAPAHALITGGGTGIGAAIARTLAAAGARVTLVARREAPLRAMAAEIDGAAWACADITVRSEVELAVEAARRAHGPVTILVANAGQASTAPFARFDFETWRAIMAVNLDSLHHLVHACLPDLTAAAHGRIVAVASTAGLRGYAYAAAYSAAKHGVVGLVRSLALEFARTPLTVNAVCPGFTDTDLVAGSIATLVERTGRSPEAARAELARFNPQGRLVQPAEVADAVHFLCRPQASSFTGQALSVAGGEVM